MEMNKFFVSVLSKKQKIKKKEEKNENFLIKWRSDRCVMFLLTKIFLPSLVDKPSGVFGC